MPIDVLTAQIASWMTVESKDQQVNLQINQVLEHQASEMFKRQVWANWRGTLYS